MPGFPRSTGTVPPALSRTRWLRSVRRALPAVAAGTAVLLCGLASPADAHGVARAQAGRPNAIGWTPCPGARGVSCGTVPVPLDWRAPHRGPVIGLHVERLAPPGPPAGVMVLVAGGPGIAATIAYSPVLPTLRRMFPGWAVVLVDTRGTGQSGLLRCPHVSVERLLGSPAGVHACQREIGPRSHFYTTADNVRDIDAVRRALGAATIGLYGTSYGTKVVQAYAHTYPGRVSRVVLDSVVTRYGPDPMRGSTWQAFPRVLREECAGGACLAATPSFEADYVRLANRIARRPLRGRFYDAAGVPVRAELTGGELLHVAINGDESPYVWLELPAAVHAALTGRPAPLLSLAPVADPASENPVVAVATSCEEDLFPWPRTSPLAGRARLWRQAVLSAPASTFGPFGPWAPLQNTFAPYGRLCQGWRAAPRPPDLGSRPLPDVPALVLAGSDDLRTPLGDSQALARQFARGRLLVARGGGHGVLPSVPCAQAQVRRWMLGGVPASRCSLAKPLPFAAAFPPGFGALHPVKYPGRLGRTVAAVRGGISDAALLAALCLRASAPGFGGVAGGRATFTGHLQQRLLLRVALRRFGWVSGARLGGVLTLAVRDFGLKAAIAGGALSVSGNRAEHGTIRVGPGGRFTGVLGGHRVRYP